MKKGKEKEEIVNGELTLKQKLFAKEFIVDLNATQAAIRAGYSEKTAGSIGNENLQKPEIREAINKELELKFKGIDELSQRLIDELKKIAFADIKEYLHFDENGVIFHNSDEVDGSVINEVSSIETITTTKGEVTNERKNLKMKLHDKMKAIELLGKYKALFTDRQEITIVDVKKLAENLDKAIGV